jgi:uncharacterized protein YkwD
VVCIALAIVALFAGCMNGTESSAFGAVNGDRNANGLPGLNENGALVTRSQVWAQHLLDSSGDQCSMAALSHSDLVVGAPTGWARLGENVGCRTDYVDPTAMVAPLEQAFMNSPHHRDNLLDSSFNSGGVGVAVKPLGDGRFLVFETQQFAQF